MLLSGQPGKAQVSERRQELQQGLLCHLNNLRTKLKQEQES